MSDNLFSKTIGTGKSRMLININGLHCLDQAVDDQLGEVWKRALARPIPHKKDDKPFEIAFIKDDGSLDMSVYVGEIKLFDFTFPTGSWRMFADSRGNGKARCGFEGILDLITRIPLSVTPPTR